MSRGVQNGWACNLLLFRQVGRLRSITLLMSITYKSKLDLFFVMAECNRVQSRPKHKSRVHRLKHAVLSIKRVNTP